MPDIEVTIRKGDLLITQPFADATEQAEVMAAFAYSFNPRAQARISAWKMALASEHQSELGLPDGFSEADLAGIRFGNQMVKPGSRVDPTRPLVD